MCPLCISTLALAVTGAISAGGASAFAITRLRGLRRARANLPTGCPQERAA
ncbi:hypothetical protein NK553_11960 [Pseudomonas sp. ZM23]|uniref:Uncharacterized protein n=1 Tax=Pseudomonas triclosanedens TaxID=2961893 RepID=A0ABY7A132_9PSED|nr:hypothetical protein [Pseudomonas triclosanedens]MCP8464664.1 hypothetical protein [Pseudomonas triclosanedens]MCP8473595.1 hypothetical protein [Pseudomonas triclosanedens]MCP8478432.1 hypothetical protein [Pseudomonas triclosanedens]WAI50856.1 hypothetical protein OU419_06255 [Pseudomonas triclosanedens]